MKLSFSSNRPDVVSVEAARHDPHRRERRGDDHRDRDVPRRERVDARSSCACSPTSPTCRSTASTVRGLQPGRLRLRRDAAARRDRRAAGERRRRSTGDGERHAGVGAARAPRPSPRPARTASSPRTRSTSRVAASSDEFNGDALDPKWTVVRPNPANLAVGGGSLTITPETGDLTTTTNTREEPRAPAGARRLDDDDEADVQRQARTPRRSRAGSSRTRTTTTT